MPKQNTLFAFYGLTDLDLEHATAHDLRRQGGVSCENSFIKLTE